MTLYEDVQQPFLSEIAGSFDLTSILCLKREQDIYGNTILLVNNMNLLKFATNFKFLSSLV